MRDFLSVYRTIVELKRSQNGVLIHYNEVFIVPLWN